MLVENTLFHGGKRVDYVGYAGDGDRRVMVIGSFLLEHLAFFYAAGGKTRSRDGRESKGVAGESGVGHVDEFFHKEVLLGFIGFHHIFDGLEAARIAGLDTQLLLGHRVIAVVEGDLQYLVHIEVARIGLKIGDTAYHRLDTSADTPVAGFFEGESKTEQICDCRRIVEESRMASRISGSPDGQPESFLVHIGMETEGYTRLVSLQVQKATEKDIGQLIACVFAVFFNAAQHYVHPQRTSGNCDGFLVLADVPKFGDFELELMDYLSKILFCPACGGLFLKERIHILVKASQTVVAANRLQYDGKMGEPNQLNSLQESLRSKFRHPAAVFRHGQKFLFPLWVGTFGRLFFCQVGVAVCKADYGLHGDYHGLPVYPLLHIVNIFTHMVGQLFLALIDIPAVAPLYHVVVVRRMVHGGLVGYAMGEHQGVQHIFHIRFLKVGGKVAEGVAMPLFHYLTQLFFFFLVAEMEVIGNPLV